MDDRTGNADATSPRLGRALILAASVLFSLGGVFTKGIDLPPTSIAFFRSLFAGLALLVVVPRARREWRPGLVPLGIAFGALIGLYIASVKATTAANAIFLQSTSTFWVVPLGLLFLRERPDARSLAGIALGTLGVCAIVGSGTSGAPGETRGVIFGLASGLGAGIIMVAMRRLSDLDPAWVSAVCNLGGALTLGAWVAASGEGLTLPGARACAILAGFGVIQMAIPWALYARALREIPATEAALIGLVEPALNPVWVALVHREIPGAATVVGGSLLLLGVAARYWPTRRPEGST